MFTRSRQQNKDLAAKHEMDQNFAKQIARTIQQKAADALFEETQNLNYENCSLMNGGYEDYFEYGGVFFGMTSGGNKLDLHSSLKEQAHVLWEQHRNLNADRVKLRQGLLSLLRRCSSDQDIRDVFPDTYTQEIKGIYRLPRTRSPGFLVQNTPHLLRQYFALTSLSDFYESLELLQ